MGYNANGELGDGTTVSKTEMVRIGSRSDWSNISTYFYYQNVIVYATCGIAGGELFCWGDGILSPQKMGTKTDWQKITGNCGIASGKIFCWETLSSQPVQIGNRDDWDQTTSYSYSEDNKYYCAISSGELFCWGNNDYGQLGDGTFESRSEPVKIGNRNDWEQVIGGYPFTCGIAGGELFCWGQNIGLTGDSSVESVNIPTKIGTSNNWSALTYFGLCGVESGNFYCFGSIAKDPLTKVGTLNEWTQISSTGNQKRCGISGGSLYCSDYLVNSGTYSEFMKITDSSGWDYVSTGDYHSCAIRNEDLYCWGNNHLGQVGDSSFEKRENPVQIGLDRKWESVSCGLLHTCGISAGEVFCWGNNGDGQAGVGNYADKIDSPAKIGKKNKWEKISAGGSHTCGIESGELYCWGSEIVFEPLKIGDRSDWEQVVSGGNSSCGIASGELFCWGQITANLTGKLRNIPTKIWNYSDFEKISVSGNLFCGLRNDKHLYCLSYSSFASGYYANAIYPEKVDEIEWDSISEGGLICGISDKILYCPFMRQYHPVEMYPVINP
jgi:alpha-tubulin suppressor-like RCC1 family protein